MSGSPKNYDRKYRGDIPLYLSLAKSLNVPTVKLGLKLGIKQVTNTLEALGVDRQEIRMVPSMFLGTFSLTPYQVSQMYQTLTNSGKRAPLTALRMVKDLDGNVLYQSMPKMLSMVDEQAAWLTTYAMKRVVMEGSGRYLQSRFGWATLAGKTGTTNDSRDSWFVGVDGREVVTVWVGRDDNQPIKLTGSSGALRVYANYLTFRTPQRLTLPWPKGIATVGFFKKSSGGLKLDCSNDFRLPVWDKDGSIQKACDSDPGVWIKDLFDW